MNSTIRHLSRIASKKNKKIIGLMSGTSLDGLDIAFCNIKGHGKDTRLSLEKFETSTYPVHMLERLKKMVSVDQVSLQEVCLAHTWLADYHAGLILEMLDEWSTDPAEIDCIASHGQTIYHAPVIKHRQNGIPNATLQIGDGDHLSRKTGIVTLSDFRQKHTAAGGEGAPMTSLVDRLLFTDDSEDRILLNIGGIANFSYLPARNNRKSDFITTDTGPGNTLINAAVQKYFDVPYDRNGEIASVGRVHPELLRSLKQDPYFKRPFPKSTGPEMFNLEWVERCRRKAGVTDEFFEDLIATLTWLSAETIAEAIQSIDGRWKKHKIPTLYLSGGGMHNKTMVNWLEDLLEGYSIRSFEKIGFNPDAKEAVSFAVLANEALSGEGFLIDPKQNTERRVNFGKISFPV